MIRAVFGSDEVEFIETKEFQGLSRMEALLDTRLAIHLVSRRVGHHMVFVIEPIMLNVVAQGCHQQSQCIKFVKLSIFVKLLGLQNKVDMLGHVTPVKVIMIRHSLKISSLNLVQKVDQLWLI